MRRDDDEGRSPFQFGYAIWQPLGQCSLYLMHLHARQCSQNGGKMSLSLPGRNGHGHLNSGRIQPVRQEPDRLSLS